MLTGPTDTGVAGTLVVVCGLPGSGKTTRSLELAEHLDAVRMCPDDDMISAGIDLHDSDARARIEAGQLQRTVELLQQGATVIIEWGTWARAERDELRDAARLVGATVHLEALSVPADVLWERICARGAEADHGSRALTRTEVDAWTDVFQAPDAAELATWDPAPW